MGPRRVLGELAQEMRRRDGSRRPSRRILEVRNVALHDLEELRIERKTPELFARLLPGVDESVHERIVSTENGCVHVSERDRNCARKRRKVNDFRGPESAGVRDGIGQDKPSLGIGVEDFNGPAGKTLHDVARLESPTRWHVLDERGDSEDVDVGLKERNCTHRANHRRRAGHVVLHLLHAVRRLDGDSPRVERHALSNQRNRSVSRCAVGPIPQHYEAGRFVRALPDSENRPHPQLPQSRFVQNVNCQSKSLCHFTGAQRQDLGCHVVAWLVDELAREVGGFAEYPAADDSALEVLRATAAGRAENERLDPALFAVGCAIHIRLVEAYQRPFDRRLGGGDDVDLRPAENGDRPGTLAAQIPHRRASELPDGVDIEVLPLADSDEKDAPRLHAPGTVEIDHVTGLAAKFVRAHEVLDEAFHRLIDLTEHANGRVLALKDRNDQCICFDLIESSGISFDVHSDSFGKIGGEV